jgi:DNA-binding CsgD family transcriptional regulator
LQDYFDISQAADVQEFERRLIAFASDMDFCIAGAEVVVQNEGSEPDYFYVGNRPKAFAAAADKSIAKVDPAMKHLRQTGLPLVYDQSFYVSAGAAELWEQAAPFGYRTGIAVALKLSNTEQFILGLDRDQALPVDPRELTRMVADVQLLAMHCQAAASKFLSRPDPPSDAPRLTKREVQVLQWASEGLTLVEIGQKIFLSEATVKFHLRNAADKLGTQGKTVTVLRAIKLGLITP